MKNSSLSMAVFGMYMAALCPLLLFVPSWFIGLFGFAPVDDVWIRVLGMVLGLLTFYYLMAVREGLETFYQWTAYARMTIIFFFGAFVALDLAPPILLLFGAFESGCGLWTFFALRRERSATGAGA